MISFTIEQLYSWVNAFFWPFVRILALLMVAPVFGESTVPRRVKAGLAALLVVAVGPALPPMPTVATASWDSFWIVIQQVIIGVALGLTMRMAFTAVQMAGDFVGLQMGLGFATFLDPATRSNTAVLARLFNLVAMLVFLALDGHLVVLSTLIRTFTLLPISAVPFSGAGWGMLLDWSAQIYVMGLLLALPLVVVLLTVNLSMGILNRTAPQLSIFSVGFPLSLTFGLVLLTVILPQTQGFLERLFAAGLEAMGRVATALGGG